MRDIAAGELTNSRELSQDAAGAKKAAERGPVVITDRGRPAHVLLSYHDYEKLLGQRPASPRRWPCRAARTSTSTRRG